MTERQPPPMEDVLDQIVDGYFEVDLAGNFTRVNAALSRISGYSQKQLTGMNNRRYTSPDTARDLFQAFSQVYRSGEPAEIVPCEILCKDLSRRMVELSVSPIQNTAGETTGFRGIARDVTRRWESQKNEETFRCRQEQIHRQDALCDMAGHLAGHFRTMCGQIKDDISQILDEIDPQNSAKFSFAQYTRIKNVERAAIQGKALLRRLTGFDDVGTGAAVYADLDDMVRIAGETVCRDLEGVEIHQQHEPKLWPVFFDRVTLGQALLAICSNSVEAMDASGKLFLRTRNLALDETEAAPLALSPGRYVQVNITDTGKGMDAQTLGRALNPFFTTKDKHAGLGLSSAYRVIRKHGGVLVLFSEKGVGATVNIFLPAVSQSPEDIPA